MTNDDKNDDIFTQKNNHIFFCKKCDFKCSHKNDWLKHKTTRKHKNDDILTQKNPKPKTKKFLCECGKEYTHRQGLWVHKQKCINNSKKNNTSDENNILTNEELILSIIKDNNDFKKMLIEQNHKIMEMGISKNMTFITNNTTHNNFNLQVFLNVQCKDALNISEFVDSLQPKIEDLETTGKLGYVEGISKIFLNGLQGLDVNKRPIHCSNQKKEILYIKDNNIWEKERETREKIKVAIKAVSNKNIKQIPLWQQENPSYVDSSSKSNDQYLQIISNAMNGESPEEIQKNYNKIISRLAKEVIIQKDNV